MENEPLKNEETIQQEKITQNKHECELENLVLEIAWKDYASSIEEKRMLDTKANMILIASGVLLGLVINGIKIMNIYCAIFALSILVISSGCCVKALTLRSYGSLGAMKTWNALNASAETRENIVNAKRDIIATLDSVVEENRRQASKIGDLIKPATRLFIAALAIITIAVILHFLSFILYCNQIY